MLNNQYNYTHETAAKKIQKFYRATKKYHELKKACLVNKNILTLRQIEIGEALSNIEPSGSKNLEFLQTIRGLKMVRMFSEDMQTNYPVPAINIAYTPAYMRDNDYKVKVFVKDILAEQFKGKDIHVLFNNQYLIMMLEEKLKSLQTIEDAIEEKNAIETYLNLLKSMGSSEIGFIEEIREISQYINPFLILTGIKPSYYKIIEALNDSENLKNMNFIMLSKFSEGLPLKDLLKTVNDIKSSLGLKNHIVINIAINLIEGLKAFKSEPEKLDNLFNQQCFYMLNCCINLMYTYRNSNHLLNYLYDIVIEEVAALLIYNGNPRKKTYSEILAELYYARIPIVKEQKWALDNFLVSNGMQAISLAIINQEDSKPKNITLKGSNYFEVDSFNKALHINTRDYLWSYESDDSIIFVTLEPSSKSDTVVSPENVCSDIKQQILKSHDNKFITIIIDVSIESNFNGENKLQNLLEGLQEYITQGKINIILVKSLQKYSLLGSSKYMAGNISIINNGDLKFNLVKEKVQKHTESLDLEKNKEYPFLTFLLEHAGQLETLMVNKVIENTNFLKELFKNQMRPGMQINHSPFIFFESGQRFVCSVLNKSSLIPNVDSFGFLHTTKLDVENRLRLNLGLETKEYLTEIFFNLSRYNQKLDSIIQMIFGEGLSEKIIAQNEFSPIKYNPEYKEDLLKYLKNTFNGDNKDYINNKIYSCLFGKMKGAGFFVEKELEAEMVHHILNTKMTGLSLEARKNLRKIELENDFIKIANLVEIDNYLNMEDLEQIKLNQDVVDKCRSFKIKADKFFHEEDAFVLLISKLNSRLILEKVNFKKDVTILNEIFKQNSLSLPVLFTIVANFVKTNIDNAYSFFLLYKLLEPSKYRSTDLPLEHKIYILEQIKEIISKMPTDKYSEEISSINRRIKEITDYTSVNPNPPKL